MTDYLVCYPELDSGSFFIWDVPRVKDSDFRQNDSLFCHPEFISGYSAYFVLVLIFPLIRGRFCLLSEWQFFSLFSIRKISFFNEMTKNYQPHFLKYFSIYFFLRKSRESVERKKPNVGTRALINTISTPIKFIKKHIKR